MSTSRSKDEPITCKRARRSLGLIPIMLASQTPDAASQVVDTTLDAVEVHASSPKMPEGVGLSRDQLSKRAGATAVLEAKLYLDGRAATVVDALSYAPGVLAQTRYGQEARLSIRGSGLQRGFLMRGIQLYQDGIPLNQTDGSGEFQSIDPLGTKFIEVWRGSNALEYGANGLGGAVNFVSSTGLGAPRLALRNQAGSFGQLQSYVGIATYDESKDLLVTVSRSEQDGWREQSAYEADRLSGNVGLMLSGNLELRLFLAHVDSKMQMPGSLTRAQLASSPRKAAPGYVDQRASNDLIQTRSALRMTWRPSPKTDLTGSFFRVERDRFHAMTVGILEQDMRDAGFNARASLNLGSPSLPRRLILGLGAAKLAGREQRSTNIGGSAGSETGRTTLRAEQDVAYAEYTHGVVPDWSIQLGLQTVSAERWLIDHLQPTSSYEAAFDGVSPKLGLLHDVSQDSQAFANLSKSFEAPPFAELVFKPGRAPTRAQEALTLEVGWRSRSQSYTWDVAIYRSRVRGELLSLTDASGVALGTVNADRTIHQGLELSGSAFLDADLQLRAHYLYNDFRFHQDITYENRRLAGVPAHYVRLELQWKPKPWLQVSPSLEWQPSGAWVDHANTVEADGFALLNLTASGEIGNGWRWFVEGRNLADRRYVSTTTVQANAHSRDGAYYFPGDGRAFYLGLSWNSSS
nr:TonB-dependent receptor [Pseudoxanthomonas sp.]